MKLTEKKYAQLLFEVLKDKSPKSAQETAAAFAGVLAERNELAKAEKIAKFFSEIWNREKGIIEAQAVTSRKTEAGVLELFRDYISSKVPGVKTVQITNQIDESVMGGVILRYQDKILDASLKTKLIDLKNKISK